MPPYKIHLVLSVNPTTTTVTLLGANTLPDNSSGLLRTGDWAMVLDGAAYALTNEYFKDSPKVLTVK